MRASVIALAMLPIVAATAGAAVKHVSPQVIACNDEATQRYIADFTQVGLPQRRSDQTPIVVTAFHNDNPRFEDYVAECMKRQAGEKTR